ncbi:hypothetical protein S83_005145 [Arachis hypogaea]
MSLSPPFALKIATRFVVVLASLPFLASSSFWSSCYSPFSLAVLLASLSRFCLRCCSKDEFLDPAVKETLNVLQSCEIAVGKHVILTSSITAVTFNGRLLTPKAVVDDTWFSIINFVRSRRRRSLIPIKLLSLKQNMRRLWKVILLLKQEGKREKEKENMKTDDKKYDKEEAAASEDEELMMRSKVYWLLCTRA